MFRIGVLGLSLVVVGVEAGCAQDIAGIEDCTKTSGLDKRTGCLQSNVNFLQRLVTKNALDARNKLDDAASEIAALKGRRDPPTKERGTASGRPEGGWRQEVGNQVVAMHITSAHPTLAGRSPALRVAARAPRTAT